MPPSHLLFDEEEEENKCQQLQFDLYLTLFPLSHSITERKKI